MTDIVSMIPYANMAPFRVMPEPADCLFVNLTPKRSVDALLKGEIVAAAIPVGALPVLGDKVVPLGAFGISAKHEVKSVMLFSDVPLHHLKRPCEIAITSQSATSIRLLYLILGYKNGFNLIPHRADYDEYATATLLIGDEALRRARDNRDPYVYDLVTEWNKVHNKPFVFARWVARSDAPPAVIEKLLGWLNGMVGQEDALILACADRESVRMGISRVEMIDYLRGMKRVFGNEELEGQALFLRELKDRVPEFVFDPAPTSHISHGMARPSSSPASPLDPGRGVTRYGPRVDRRQGLRMLRDVSLGELMSRAHQARSERHPDGLVTYVMDTNPNYTNICLTKCDFCAFCRDKDAPDAYVLSPEDLAEKVRFAQEQGARTVLVQGGHNPKVLLSDWVSYIQAIRKACPEMHIHPFSAPEILDMAKKERISPKAVLERLKGEGIDTLPGGGAEILSNAVRFAIAPKKCSADDWMSVTEIAHQLGFKTTATMMFGHLETDEDIVEHLFRLRDLQDKTHGFSSFIPWSFKPGNSSLSERVIQGAHPGRYVRIIATARLVLDNFDHIQSSWFSESERAGMLGLMAGADDFGGILVEENVLKTSGYERRTSADKVRALIRHCGYIPAERDSHYNVITIG